jgi:hypothetical protein
MVNDFDAQAVNQILKIIVNETVDEVEFVRQNISGLSGICSRVTLAVVKAEKALPLLRQERSRGPVLLNGTVEELPASELKKPFVRANYRRF